MGLIHPASAGHGLNLQGNQDANCIVWFSMTDCFQLLFLKKCDKDLNREKVTVRVSNSFVTERKPGLLWAEAMELPGRKQGSSALRPSAVC